jgi:hypothetical protein
MSMICARLIRGCLSNGSDPGALHLRTAELAAGPADASFAALSDATLDQVLDELKRKEKVDGHKKKK